MIRLFAALRRQTPDALVRAANDGDIAKVESLLDAGVPVDARDSKGQTAMMAAAMRGHVELLERLVKRGAYVDAMAPNGGTALGIAAQSGDPACVQLLLKAGADANAGSSAGVTPLMLAAKAGSLSSVRTLLANAADIGAAVRSSIPMAQEPGDILGFTALAFAVLLDHAEVVRVLRAHGARLNPCLSKGFTLLGLAAAHNSESSARMLLTLGVDPNQPMGAGPFAGQTAIMIANQHGHADLSALLLAHGAEVTGTRIKAAAPSRMLLRRTG